MNTTLTTRQRLYGAYVSSGQAGATPVMDDARATFAFKKPYANYLINSFLPGNKSAAILDLGCGYGPYVYHLKEAGYTNVTGVDASAEQVALAHAMGVREVLLADITAFLQQTTDTYDVVLLMDVLEHLTTAESVALLDLVYAKLTDTGKLLIHTPNAEGIFGMSIRYGDLTHETAFTATSMQQLLAIIGFKSVSCHEDRPLVHGAVSLVRRWLWTLLTLRFRLLLMAETGGTRFILSQNMLTIGSK